MVVFIIQRIDRYSLLVCVPRTAAVYTRPCSVRFLHDTSPMTFLDLMIRWVESSDFGAKKLGQNLTSWAIAFSNQILSRRICNIGLHKKTGSFFRLKIKI